MDACIKLFTSSGPVNTIVVLRCRPLLEMEKEGGGKSVLSCTLNDVTVEGITTNKQSRVYHFDRVFNTEASQADVYNSVIAPVVHRVLEVGRETIQVLAYVFLVLAGAVSSSRSHGSGNDLSVLYGVLV